MSNTRNGLTDSDKIFVTVALWISAVTLFATALSLPMLPDTITMFYPPADTDGDFFSKYNNLLLIIMSVIPATIVIVTSELKSRHRLQNNFMSMVLFSIMLAVTLAGVVIYGIRQQFDASSTVRSVNWHGVGCILVLFVFAILSAVTPTIVHSRNYNSPDAQWRVRLASNADKYWSAGVYTFLICAIVCAFVPGPFCYIPFGLCVAAYLCFLLLYKKQKKMPQADFDHDAE